MTEIEEMIAELCPNGVEWKELGEVCEIIRGNGLQKKDFVDQGVPCIHYGQIYTYYGRYTDITKSFVTEEVARKLKKAQNGDLIVATTSENISDVGKALVWLGDNEVCIGGHSCLIRTNLDAKYLSHVFQTVNFQKQKERQVVGTKVIELYPKNLAKIKIPIPPLEIQEKIVQILDKFTDYVTELTAELTAELTLRQKQYSFYRDKLLSFEDEENKVEWKMLEEICEFRRGSFPQPYGNAEWYGGEGSKPFIQVADVSDSGYRLNEKTKNLISKVAMPKSVFVPTGTVLVTLQGTIGRVAITQYDAYVDRTLGIFTAFKIPVDKRYFAYQLKNKFNAEKKTARGSTLKTITKEEFSKFQLPVPPLPIQEKIVHVLDNFDTVCNDLNIGLPKEIELRQKQYEYFREKLLTYLAEGEYHEDRIGEGNPSTFILLQWVFGTVRTTLGSVAKVQRGASPRPISQYITEKDGIPWIKIGDTSATSKYVYSTKQHITHEGARKSRVLKPGDFILSNSMSYGRPYILAIEGAIHDGWAAISDFESYIVSDFLYHYLISNKVQKYWEGKLNSGSVSNLNSDIINSLPIILPSLKKQAEIVEILDKFNTLTNSISDGLPKEIELRQKQYEYWRDKLLRFH